MLSGISPSFERLSRTGRQVVYVLLTRSPLYRPARRQAFAFDLHVLGTPPAFVLSQDQTLELNCNSRSTAGKPEPLFERPFAPRVPYLQTRSTSKDKNVLDRDRPLARLLRMPILLSKIHRSPSGELPLTPAPHPTGRTPRVSPTLPPPPTPRQGGGLRSPPGARRGLPFGFARKNGRGSLGGRGLGAANRGTLNAVANLISRTGLAVFNPGRCQRVSGRPRRKFPLHSLRE